MAKFRSGDLILRDSQYVIFGDDSDAHIGFNGTELEINSTVSGVDPVNSYDLATKNYVDNHVPTISGYVTEEYLTTVSGDIVAQIPTDYVSDSEMTTISGDIVAQIPPAFSITKGRYSIPNGVDNFTISFTDVGNTDYVINTTLVNPIDAIDSIYAYVVSEVTTSGFTVTLMGETDSENYLMHWSILE
ncbi:MAG: hypothetical protein EHM12_11110 [Dehalococcoidia bacterium]|nr:MAG: hypothetical protein EHM12_11110 [Dehalococcoidia bacterium]